MFTFGDVLASKVAKPVTYVNPPTHCDTCKQPITTEFVDGATRMGSWANMCMLCFKQHGKGLGTGRGQRYVLDSTGTYVKVEG